jgi:hypothetical protein
MKKSVRRMIRRDNTARNAWIVFGGLVALGVLAMTVRELPSIRREARLMRM